MLWINLLAVNRNSISEFETSGLDHPNQSTGSGVLGSLPMKLSNKFIANILIINKRAPLACAGRLVDTLRLH